MGWGGVGFGGEGSEREGRRAGRGGGRRGRSRQCEVEGETPSSVKRSFKAGKTDDRRRCIFCCTAVEYFTYLMSLLMKARLLVVFSTGSMSEHSRLE